MAKTKKTRWDEHPSIIVVNGKPRLKVFEEYFVEEDLPKFKKLTEAEAAAAKEVDGKMPSLESGGALMPNWQAREDVQPRETDLQAAHNAQWTRSRYVMLRTGNNLSGDTNHGIGPLHQAIKTAKAWLAGLSDGAKTPEPLSVEEAFALAKGESIVVTTEELLRSRAIAAALVRRFEQTCQYGMARKVRDHLDVLAAKIALAERGMCRYITEEQAIEFMTKAERGVQVEFLRYYPEVIPVDVSAKVAECNLAFLFDNYVVMYYSTNVKPVRLLEEEVDEAERHKRRDPILFGTLRGSRNLYYVADWVYKDDDLTLETVEKAIGTIPTLKDERIEDSQLKISELLHDATDRADKDIAEARDRGQILPLKELPEPSPGTDVPDAPDAPAE